MSSDQGKVAVSNALHERTLDLPWANSGMHVLWELVPHVEVDLSSEGDVRSALEGIEGVGMLSHESAVLLNSAFSPSVLCSLREALDDFDEMLEGPGFIFGADCSPGLVSVFAGDFAYYDGADHLFLATTVADGQGVLEFEPTGFESRSG